MPDQDGELRKARREELPKLVFHEFTIHTTQSIPDGMDEQEARAIGWMKIVKVLRDAGIIAREQGGDPLNIKLSLAEQSNPTWGHMDEQLDAIGGMFDGAK